ncbi:MAG: adenosylcobinamide-GDP ribazoletransferase [Bacteroidota bacterium]
MLREELKIFFTAVMFYTRIPVPKSTGFSPEALNRATRYFPLIGILVGGAGGAVFLGSSQFLGIHLSIVISLLFTVLLTGAFHEDGLADFCDGFGGGVSKEKILAIMKDSRLGTYGTIALIMLFLVKTGLIAEIGLREIPLAILVAGAWSRLNPVLLIYTSTYVTDTDGSKSKPVGLKGSAATLVIALIFGLAPLLLVDWKIIPLLVGTQLIILLLFRGYLHRKIGGFTGDTLGALQQLSEVGFYLTCVAATQVM